MTMKLGGDNYQSFGTMKNSLFAGIKSGMSGMAALGSNNNGGIRRKLTLHWCVNATLLRVRVEYATKLVEKGRH